MQNQTSIESVVERPLITALHKLALLLCLLLFWMLCESALASQGYEGSHALENEVVKNLILKTIDGSEPIETPVSLSTDFALEVNGPIVRATVTQQFENPSDEWVEGIYSYPLPENAAVDQLEMHIGERIIEGQIKEKRDARKIYAKAKREGKRAALLEKPKGNLFTTKVANIAPGAKLNIVFSYQTILDFKDHGYSLRIPIVATPQYDPGIARGKAGVVPTENRIEYRAPFEPDENPVRFLLNIGAGMPVDRVWSDSHSLEIERQGETRFTVKAGGQANDSNRDFVLNWRYLAKEHAQVSLFSEEVNGEYYNMLMLMPPAPDSPIDVSKRELIFVLDVSGSMSGPSIRQAKGAIKSALNQLEVDDRFNIIFFNDTAWPMFKRSQQATSKNIQKASAALARQEAEKGTEISSALDLALKRNAGEGLRQVVFITDGAVTNEDWLLGQIKRTLGESRLFTVGIGSAPNSYFMRRAAEMGKGTFTYISDVAQVHEKMQRLLAKLNNPALTDIAIAMDVPLEDLMPDPVPDLYMNETANLFFRTASLPTELHVEALHGETPAYLQQSVGESKAMRGISVAWARQKIKSLTEQALNTTSQDRDLIKAEATNLALEHHQVSRYTSLVAVDVTSVRAGADLKTRKVRSNLPKGWQSQKPEPQIYHLAQTATNAPWLTQSGLLWLCIAMALWLITRVRRARVVGQKKGGGDV